jgi:dTDP-4-dehydrorhamnose 3,5-epimerase
MKITNLPLNGAAEIHSPTLKDERGWFSRYFCQKELSVINGDKNIVQINSSFTKLTGTIRGLHLQHSPHEEDKIVRCITGKIFDVMLDARLGSITYGKWHSVILDAQKMNMVYIPKGFAHGFQTLEPNCEILYLHTQFHTPKAEGGYRYDSPELNIGWPLEIAEVSARDKNLEIFPECRSQK